MLCPQCGTEMENVLDCYLCSCGIGYAVGKNDTGFYDKDTNFLGETLEEVQQTLQKQKEK